MFYLKSRINIIRSLLPEHNKSSFHANEPKIISSTFYPWNENIFEDRN